MKSETSSVKPPVSKSTETTALGHSEMLTPSELAELRRVAKEQSELLRQELAKRKKSEK